MAIGAMHTSVSLIGLFLSIEALSSLPSHRPDIPGSMLEIYYEATVDTLAILVTSATIFKIRLTLLSSTRIISLPRS